MLNNKDIGKAIRDARTAKKISATELSKRTGLPISSLSEWENGKSSAPASAVFKICKALDISPNIIADSVYEINPSINDKLLSSEAEINSSYASLSIRQKQTLQDIVKAQLGIADNLKVKPLKLFNQSACAGDGNYIDSQDYEIVEFINPPKTAEYAIKVQGNSMQPLIDDGDIVYINNSTQLLNNDIGVFVYQGETFIKQYKKENGKMLLHALNPKFGDIEISSPSEFYILGRVL